MLLLHLEHINLSTASLTEKERAKGVLAKHSEGMLEVLQPTAAAKSRRGRHMVRAKQFTDMVMRHTDSLVILLLQYLYIGQVEDGVVHPPPSVPTHSLLGT